jgi:hypothetical protein
MKSCSSFEDLSAFKISWSHVDQCKFCILLRSLNICHFGMGRTTGLKTVTLKSNSVALPPCWISRMLLIGSKYIRWTYRQTAWWSHKPDTFFKEGRLKRESDPKKEGITGRWTGVIHDYRHISAERGKCPTHCVKSRFIVLCLGSFVGLSKVTISCLLLNRKVLHDCGLIAKAHVLTLCQNLCVVGWRRNK